MYKMRKKTSNGFFNEQILKKEINESTQTKIQCQHNANKSVCVETVAYLKLSVFNWFSLVMYLY